ncbi:DUF7507 domain-containing protein [Clostridium sp. LP20]|uniref:DUF7507 domain-containing protein n=1 Tax=Clostridium sp. LP20 TaxID=3418665 RepID=UPI003EE72E5E
MVVSNLGPSDAENVVLTDNIPSTIIEPLFSIDGGITFNPWVSPYFIGTLVNGDSSTIIIKGTVSSSALGTISNTAIVESTTIDPNPSNNISTITTQVNTSADISVLKTASPTPVIAGESIVYTVVVSNAGPSDAQNVSLTDLIPSTIAETEFSVDGGVTFNPWLNTYTIGTVENGESKTIIIRGKVSSSTTVSITNTASVDSTTPDPDPGNNTVTIVTPINTSADISVIKTTNHVSAIPGETIVYTIVTTNSGPSDAQNVNLTDLIPPTIIGAQFSVDGGITFNPWPGFNNIGTIAVDASSTILIMGRISNSATEDISNTSKVNSITPDPDPTNNSSTAIINIAIATVDSVKATDKGITTPGDVITFTITNKNTGNTPVDNVILNDNLPIGTTFIPGTVTINGVQSPSEDPRVGIRLGTIEPNETVTTAFKVRVLQDAPKQLLNSANVNFSYIVDPNEQPIIDNTTTNIVTINVLVPELTLVKVADRTGAVVGDLIRYTIVSSNTGEIPLEDIVVTDLLNPDIQFANNLTIDSVPSEQNITTGVNIGNVDPGHSRTISFNAEVINVPNDKIVDNTSTATFIYQVLGNIFGGNSASNEVIVTIFSPELTVTKSSDKMSVKIGDIFNYTIKVQNTGDIAIHNIIIQDDLPSQLQAIAIEVDGILISGDIGVGVNIGSLLPGQIVTVILSIKALASLTTVFRNIAVASGEVIVDPSKPPVEVNGSGKDNIGIEVFNPELTITKSVDKQCAVVGDILTYKIVVTNTGDLVLGNVELDPVFIYDILNPNLEFVSGSLRIDGIPDLQSGIVNGVDLGIIEVGNSKIITFQVKIISDSEIPILNTTNSTFGYQLPGNEPETGTAKSNTVQVCVNLADIDIIKKADKKFVSLGGTINYTVTLTNIGTVDALNVIFTDKLPNIVELIEGSFSVNGVKINGVDIGKGINIGTIEVGEQVIVKYSIKVVKSNCELQIINRVKLKFSYKIFNSLGATCGSGTTETSGTPTSSAVVKLRISNFKQFNIEENLIIPAIKPNIEEIEDVKATIEILKYYVIKTPNVISNDGQILTGFKLIVHGIINEIVEYTALNEEQSVHSAHFAIPFTTFIVLPKDSCNIVNRKINAAIENIYFKKVDCRSFFTNATVLLDAIVGNCE